MQHFVKLEVIKTENGSISTEIFNKDYITGAFKAGPEASMLTLKDKLPVMVNYPLDRLLEQLNGLADYSA